MGRLTRLARERQGGFAAIWGRRRIGKSELLKEWCRKFDGIYTVADQSLAAVQRTSFAIALSERFVGFADVSYPSWKALFEALSRRARAEDWHGPLVMDEFPYWVEADDSLPSVLQNWVDGEKRLGGIVCAIAGSVQHMMQGLVLDSDSPLYGRVDEKIKLPPIDIGYVRDAFRLEHAIDAVKAYLQVLVCRIGKAAVCFRQRTSRGSPGDLEAMPRSSVWNGVGGTRTFVNCQIQSAWLSGR